MENATHGEIIMKRFKSLLEGHSHRQHSVTWYADALMITPDYLSKLIREKEGRSARSMINESIINNAKVLMKQPELSLKEISERLNFPDQSSFGRFFKTNTGHSPKEFRIHLYGQEES
jgi:YesN/AraC family two-component response regulator